MSKQNELAQLADAVTVDGGNVGIGVVPESSYPDRPVLRIGSGLGLMCRASGNPSHTWINSNAYQDPSSADDKYIATDEASQIRQTNGSIHFMTAESGSANSTISWTNAMSVMKTGGITFNGDTAAANALDDYEEGTWTPRIVGSSSESGQSYQRQTGHYTKIGNQVFCRFILNFSARGTFSGDYIMDGFPFNFEAPADIHLCNLYHSYVGQNVISVGLYNRQNDNKAYIWIKTQAGQSREYPNSSFLTNDTELSGSFTLQTTA